MDQFKTQIHRKLDCGVFQLYNNATQNGRYVHVHARDVVTLHAEPLCGVHVYVGMSHVSCLVQIFFHQPYLLRFHFRANYNFLILA